MNLTVLVSTSVLVPVLAPVSVPVVSVVPGPTSSSLATGVDVPLSTVTVSPLFVIFVSNDKRCDSSFLIELIHALLTLLVIVPFTLKERSVDEDPSFWESVTMTCDSSTLYLSLTTSLDILLTILCWVIERE